MNKLSLMLVAALGIACSTAGSISSDGEKASASNDPFACSTCHLPEYQSAKHHVGVKPKTCGVCHASEQWRPTTLHHPWWELTGAHAKAKCEYCHQNDVFRRTTKDCFACHEPEYEKAPKHEGRATTCASCHGTAAWKPAHPDMALMPPPAPASAAPTESAIPSATASAPPKPPKPKPVKPPPPKPHPDQPEDPDVVTRPSWHR